MLEVRGVYKRFGGVVALEDVSLAVAPGEVVAVVGPNGSGKTTLVNVISGYVAPDRGSVLLEGRDITRWSAERRVRAGVVRSFQFPLLFPNLTVEENLRVAASGLKPYTLGEVDRRVVEETLHLFDLEAVRRRRVTELSEGHRKLLDVALAFVFKPKVVLLDEPTSSVSSQEKFAVMEKIVEVVKKSGASAVVVEHDLEVVKKFTDRVVQMMAGRVVKVAKTAEWSHD